MFDHMSFEELRQAYNASPKPNVYGQEMLSRIHAEDRGEMVVRHNGAGFAPKSAV